jgi:hypothetical protein
MPLLAIGWNDYVGYGWCLINARADNGCMALRSGQSSVDRVCLSAISNGHEMSSYFVSWFFLVLLPVKMVRSEIGYMIWKSFLKMKSTHFFVTHDRMAHPV